MTGLLLTRNTTPILSQFAAILGWLIEKILDLLYSMGQSNVGLAIILFTIVVYTLMIPLTYKQQKFSRMSVRMNPEIQAIQKYGAVKGSVLAAWRILRCNPFSSGGYDPVP